MSSTCVPPRQCPNPSIKDKPWDLEPLNCIARLIEKMSKLILLPLLALVYVATVSADGAGHDWDYDESFGRVKPDQWHEHYEHCGGQRQSPIDVIDKAIKGDKVLRPLKFTGYDQPLTNLPIQNDGHTLKVTIPKNYNLQISSDSLPAPYKLTQFHFHWPSEHTVNGEQFPLELHFVHANTKLPDNEVTTNQNGLVVVAVLFDYGKGFKSADALRTLTNTISANTTHEGDSSTLSTLKLSDLLPTNTSNYIRYSGSLTTPPCAEVVEFHILTNTLPISVVDVYRFAQMRHEIHTSAEEEENVSIKHNDRPQQALNGRQLRLYGNKGDLANRF